MCRHALRNLWSISRSFLSLSDVVTTSESIKSYEQRTTEQTFDSFKMNVVIVVLLVSLVSAVVVSNRVTFIVTSTALVTTTSTSTKSTSTACVIYSNAPSACPSRRKRQVWLKPPIIAEDEVDKNQLIQPQPVQW